MDRLSLLPAELQWQIYFQCWRDGIREVNCWVRMKVQPASGAGHFLQRSLVNRRRRPCPEWTWTRNSGRFWQLWGWWCRGKARHLIAGKHRALMHHNKYQCDCSDPLTCQLMIEGFRYRTMEHHFSREGLARHDNCPACQKLSEYEIRCLLFPRFSN
jgi:hypothetical protein